MTHIIDRRIFFSLPLMGSSLLGIIASSCQTVATPAVDAEKFLKQGNAVPSEAVSALVSGRRLTHEQIKKFAQSESDDVRFMVAKNSSLDVAELNVLVRDREAFVRGGAASNLKISERQALTLSRDDSHTVYASLAKNPATPEYILLDLRKNRKLGLIFFAMNPECPKNIREEIRESDNKSAKHWLTINSTVR